MAVIGKDTGVKLLLGEAGTKLKDGHVLITVPGYLHEKLKRASDLDLSAIKMIVLDEADELFI